MEQIIARIQKLLALAKDGSGATEEEAKRAMEFASALMLRHNLSMHEVVQQERGKKEGPISEYSKGERKFEILLWSAAAKLNLCMYYYTRDKYFGLRHYMVGPRMNVEVAVMTANYLVSTVVRLAKESAKTSGTDRKGPYRKAFRAGCSERVNYRAWQLFDLRKKQATVVVAPDGERVNLPALLPEHERITKEIDRFLEDKGVRLQTSKGMRFRHSSVKGYLEGQQSGNALPLEPQIRG